MQMIDCKPIINWRNSNEQFDLTEMLMKRYRNSVVKINKNLT